MQELRDMVRALKSLSILVLFVLSFDACRDSVSPSTPSTTLEILPLSIGNTWTFKATFYDTAGIIIVVDTFQNIVRKDTMINNQEWYVTNFGVFRNDPQGLWQYWANTPFLKLKYPGSPSDTFLVEGRTYKIISTDEPKTTLLGILHCYHYQRTLPNSNQFQYDEYYSPGVGEVSFEMGDFLYPGRWWRQATYELLRYTIF